MIQDQKMLRVGIMIRVKRFTFEVSILSAVVPVSNVDHECYNTLKNITFV